MTRLLKSDHTILYTSRLTTVDLTGRARFRVGPREVTLSTGEIVVQARVPILGVDVDELPGGEALEEDTVSIVGRDGGDFRVVGKTVDAHGLAELQLHEF